MNKQLIVLSIAFLAIKGKIISQVNNAETLATLTKQIAVLEAKVNDLTTRLPYHQMAVMTLETSDANMTSKMLEGKKYYSHDIKIDNPICNNNPKAIIMANRQQDGVNSMDEDVRPVNIFYNRGDSYWYLRSPDKIISGMALGITIDQVWNLGQLAGREQKITGAPWGVGYVTGIYQKPGEKYSVVIFDKLNTPMKPKTTLDELAVEVVVNEKTEPTKQANPYDISISGEWAYKLTSAGGAVIAGKVFLVITDNSVTGNLYAPDKSKSEITGTFVNTTLSLRRETGLQTTQVYELTRTGAKQFSGSYSNQGKYPDSGKVEFYR